MTWKHATYREKTSGKSEETPEKTGEPNTRKEK